MEQATHSEEMRQVMVLMERMGDDIKLLAEGQSDIRRDISDLKSGQERLEVRMERVESDVAGLKSDVSSLKSDVADLKSGQSQILEYMARSEEEMAVARQDRADNAAWHRKAESRFSVLEEAAGLVRDGKKE